MNPSAERCPLINRFLNIAFTASSSPSWHCDLCLIPGSSNEPFLGKISGHEIQGFHVPAFLLSRLPPAAPKFTLRVRYGVNTRRAKVAFELPPLPFAYDALQPYMSAETLQFHHDKHHAAYVDNANKLVAGTEFEGKSLEEVIKASFGKNPAVFNNAGQHYNHSLFWKGMKAGGGGNKVPGALAAKIESDLGGFDKFRADIIQAGMTQFGSGWAWLSLKDGKLEIAKTPNAETPLVHGAKPLLVTDVWEHAYYIDYRNLRAKFLEAWFDNLINWEFVEAQYDAAK